MTWEDKFKQNLLEILYRPDQPRDEKGRWTTTGTAGAAGDDAALMPAPNIGSFVKEGGVVELSAETYGRRAGTKEFTPEQQASIARAFEDTLGDVQLDGVILELPEEGYFMGQYLVRENTIRFHAVQDYSPEGLERISQQNEEHLAKRKAFAEEAKEKYDSIREAYKDFQAGRGTYPDFVDPNTGEVLFEKPRTGPLGGARHRKAEDYFKEHELQDTLREYREAAQHGDPILAASRAYTYSDLQVKDPLYAIAKHEAYHAVYHQRELKYSWIDNMRKHNVSALDWVRVSEYAGTNIGELFSETGTAIDLGLSVPDTVRQAFEDTIALR